MIGGKLIASIAKELLLLVRDRAGLVLLFVMPAFLVIVITLIQEKVTTTTVEVLFVDNDKGAIGTEIRNLFARIDTIRLVGELDGEELSADRVHRLVAAGRYQFGVVLPEGLSAIADKAAQQQVVHHLFPEREKPPSSPFLRFSSGSIRRCTAVSGRRCVLRSIGWSRGCRPGSWSNTVWPSCRTRSAKVSARR